MGKRQDRQEYIHNFAIKIQGTLKIPSSEFKTVFESGPKDVAQSLLKKYGDAIYSYLIYRSDEVCGRLACCGVGTSSSSFDQMDNTWHCNVYPNLKAALAEYEPNRGGLELVKTLATNSVIAAMADNIWSELKNAKPKRSQGSGAFGAGSEGLPVISTNGTAKY